MTISLFSRKDGVRRPTRMSHGLLVACPLLFSGTVALYSRHYTDGYQVHTSTPLQEDRVLAYAPLIHEQYRIFSKSNSSVDRTKLLALANKWADEARDGKLQPLEKVSFDDSLQQGVRGQIFRTESAIVSALFDDADQLAANGQVDQAVREVLLGVKLSESVKYSDFNSVFLASEQEMRASSFVRRNKDGLSRDTKQQAKEVFNQVAANFANLDAMTKQSRAQYYEWAARISNNPVSLEDVQRIAMVTNQIASNPGSAKSIFYVRTSIVDSQEDNSPEYLSELRMAWRAEKTNQASCQQLVRDI